MTEDPERLGIYTPEHERKRREEKQEEAEQQHVWEKQARAWLNNGGKVYYNPRGGKNYHFVPDCPLVKADYLPLTELDQSEEIFKRLTPCPGCVQRAELWAVQEKIRYGAMHCAFPEANWIPEEKAVEIARIALEERGFDLTGLYPITVTGSAGDEEPLYAVYFASVILDDLGFAAIDCLFSATLNGVTGEVITAGESIDSE